MLYNFINEVDASDLTYNKKDTNNNNVNYGEKIMLNAHNEIKYSNCMASKKRSSDEGSSSTSHHASNDDGDDEEDVTHEKKVKLDVSKAQKRNWIQDKSNRLHYRQINDMIHDRIQIFYPLQKIIDTSEFQRLRYIRQLGFCYLIYPAADHCRFTHSLGVYSLARSFIKELAESQVELNISTQDQLCICIAALVHDLGHGPFSHFYEAFLNVADPGHQFKHEESSKRLFRRMIEINEEVRTALDDYLDETDLVFIEELIDPPVPFIVDGKWQLKGRPIEKSFLYDIVSNKHNGLDVDKFDYFLRDSLLGNMPIPFSMTTVGRIRDNAKVLFDENLGFRRLVFAEKNMDEIRDAFEARVMLHDRIYQHKTCISVELSMIETLLAANKYFKISGGDGKFYTLSTAYKNDFAFLSIDDRLIYLLKNSTSEKLKPARELFQKVEHRQLPRFVCAISLDNFENEIITEDEVKHGILKLCGGLDESHIRVKIHCVHRGMGVEKRPIESVRIYNDRILPSCRFKEISKVWFKYNTIPSGGKAVANIYAPFGTCTELLNVLHQAAITFEAECSTSR